MHPTLHDTSRAVQALRTETRRQGTKLRRLNRHVETLLGEVLGKPVDDQFEALLLYTTHKLLYGNLLARLGRYRDAELQYSRSHNIYEIRGLRPRELKEPKDTQLRTVTAKCHQNWFLVKFLECPNKQSIIDVVRWKDLDQTDQLGNACYIAAVMSWMYNEQSNARRYASEALQYVAATSTQHRVLTLMLKGQLPTTAEEMRQAGLFPLLGPNNLVD